MTGRFADLGSLRAAFPHAGTVTWIGVRPARGRELHALQQVVVEPGRGLHGDRFGAEGQRPVRACSRELTLIQAEHLPAIAAAVRLERIEPAILRRNLVVAGINLLALRGWEVALGDAVRIEVTGHCHPCSRMERLLGPGGYNAVRGHGGVTARVVHGGVIAVGTEVRAVALAGPGRRGAAPPGEPER